MKINGLTLWKWVQVKQKSPLIILLIYILKKINAVLIIAPKSVYTIWENEIETHLPNEIKYKIFKWNIDKPKDY